MRMLNEGREYRKEQRREQSLLPAPEKADQVGQNNRPHPKKGSQDTGCRGK